MPRKGTGSILQKVISKRKRIFLIVFSVLAGIGVLLGLLVLFFDWRVRVTTEERILTVDDLTGEYDCIFVLGCGVRADGTPSKMLRDRLETAVLLYEMGVSEYILCSGDNGKVDYNEVGVMKKYLMDKGVPENAIYLDHAGFSTYESACRAKAIFGLTTAVVVTQEYHMYRALYTLIDKGVDAVGVPAIDARYNGQTMRDLREIVARCKDYIYCIFDPDPTYLGDPIEIGKK